MTNDYAIVPEDEFSKLKNDVKTIRDNPLGATEEGKSMVATLTELNKSMGGLVNLFNVATDELKQEEHDASLVSEKIGPLMDRLANLESQNEKIAKGIVAVADMIKELKEERRQEPVSVPAPAPVVPQMPSPAPQTPPPQQSSFSQSAQGAPSSMSSQPGMGGMGMSMEPEMKPLPTNNLPDMGGAPKPDKKNMFHF